MQAEAQIAQEVLLGIRLEGWLTLAAVLAGPILAVQAQRFVERKREQQNRKLFLFRELMATRGSRISSRHVDALNAIQVEFYAKRGQEKVVYEKWKEYLDHLNKTTDGPTETKV